MARPQPPKIEKAPEVIIESDETHEAPPIDVMDADVPADIFSEAAMPTLPAVTKPDNELEYVAELTQADKIEAACAKLHPQVRHFIEEELRGRFVAVQTTVKQA